jgi:DNA-binding YbaB/EbfC family protein
MTDLNELMKQAKNMQEQMQSAQREVESIEVIGESGAGLVKVHMNGRYDVKKVELDPTLLSEEKEVMEDLIAAAINNAVKKLQELNRQAMSGLAGGFKLPDGFKFPF